MELLISSLLLLRCSSLPASSYKVLALFILTGAVTVAEASDLVHVEPQAVKLELLIKVTEARLPNCSRVLVEPVKENSRFGPDLLLDRAKVVDLLEQCELVISHGNILAVLGVGKSCIDNRNKFLISRVPGGDLLGESLEGATCSIVNREVSIVLHVRDVKPDAVQWNVVLFILVNILRHSVDRVISVGGSMPAESPEWRETGLASDSDVSLDYLLSRALHEEVSMDNAASRDVAEYGLAFLAVLNDG